MQRIGWCSQSTAGPDFLYVLGVTPVAAENYHEQFASYLIGDETVSYMRITPKGTLMFGTLSYRGKIIHEELGLKPVDAFPQDEGSVEVSLEVLPDYNPDHIILQVDSGGDEDAATKIYDGMAETAIWNSLNAVKNGHVYLVGDNEWFNVGYSPIANLYAIDQIVSEFEKNE